MDSASLLFFTLAFFSEMLGTITGFGSSLFFVPLAGLLFDLKTTLALTALLHILSTTAQLLAFRHEMRWRLIWTMGIPSLFFVIIGAALSSVKQFKYAELVMGLFLTSYALISLTNKNFKIKPTDQNAIIGGGLSGLLTGLIGTGGAIRGAALSAFGLSKGAFISTSAAIDLSSDLARAAIYLKQGYLEARYYSYLPGLLLAAYAGVFSGKKILTFFTPRMFRTLVLLLILGTGLFLIYKETSELIQS